MAALLGSLCALTEASKINSDLSYYNNDEYSSNYDSDYNLGNTNDGDDAILLKRGGRSRSYSGGGGGSEFIDYMWFLLILICAPLYCCLKCGCFNKLF